MINYQLKADITAIQFKDVLLNSTLGERRRLDDINRIQRNIDNADFLVSAWDDGKLVGISRGLTDNGDVAYLADLAVDESYQHQGIGKKLVEMTREIVGTDVTLLLFAAPAAKEYYPKIGFTANENGYFIGAE